MRKISLVLRSFLIFAVCHQLRLFAGAASTDKSKNMWIAYSETGCCPERKVRHHKDHVWEFACGKFYYRTMYMDEKRDALFIGAMDKLYRLNLTNISSSNCQKNVIELEADDVRSCTNKGKSEHFDCKNHIRVIQPIGDGNLLYICGTNAHHPKDWVIYANMTTFPRGKHFPGLGSGTAKCPFDPEDNSTAIWVEKGNPGGLPGLYSGTNAEFTKADTGIFRSDLYNLSSGQKEYDYRRTPKYDSKWLEMTQFVGSFDIGEYVYFFFRETAVEYINCGKSIYSRVARVCKNDNGGRNILAKNWATFLKARLNCTIPGEFPFYFNEIQSIYRIPGEDDVFYGTFTTSTIGLTGSAICAFNLNDIQGAFNGKFKEQSNSRTLWLPVKTTDVPSPRPGVCVNDTKSLPDPVLTFLRTHPLMDEAVRHRDKMPIFYKRDILFTHLVVDRLNHDDLGYNRNYLVFYAGTDQGRVYKIAQWANDEGGTESVLLDIYEVTPNEPIRMMTISKKHKSLYVSSDDRVRQINLVMCNKRYDNNCFRCVHDPYCGWDKDANVCKPYNPALLQDVTRSEKGICDSSVNNVPVNATFGQSIHLACFLKLPLVLSSQPVKWRHHHKERGIYDISYTDRKYIETSERGLVILSVSDLDSGRYECYVGPSLLCSFNVTVEDHRCKAPNDREKYKKIYADWCVEFQRYKEALKKWQTDMGTCSARRGKNDTLAPHENEITKLG